jgi:hypothetical protein
LAPGLLLAAVVIATCGHGSAVPYKDLSKPPLPPSAPAAVEAARSEGELSEVEESKLERLREQESHPEPAGKVLPPRAAEGGWPSNTLVPPRLSDRDPCSYTTLFQHGMYASWMNHDFYALPYYTYYWTLVAVTADSGDIDPDLKAWQTWNSGGEFPDCVSDFIEGSQAGGTYVDFIVGDFNHNPSTTTYFEAFAYSGSGKYLLVSDAGSDIILTDGTPVHRDISEYYVGEIWDVYLNGGVEYAFDLEATSPHIRMSLFASNSSEYWASRGGGVWDVAGDTLWTAPVTDWYGLVVYADHQATGSFDLRVGPPCEHTPLASGVAQGATDAEFWSFDQTYPCWSAIGLRRSSGTGNPDLYVYKSWDEGGATPDCVDTLLCNCAWTDAEYTDIVVGNFYWEDPGTYYAETSWEYGSGVYTVFWDAYGEAAPTDGTPISMSMGPTDLVRVWDVYLEAGREYTFHFNPTGTDLRLALFPPYEHWTPRWNAAFETAGNAVWTPLLTLPHGLVVFNEGGGTGSFELSITTPCTYQHLPEGTLIGGEWDPEFYRFTQLEQGWTVVATRAMNPEYSDADIQVYGSWSGGNHPHCATDLLAGSGLPASSVDFVAGNCWESPLGTYFVKNDWFSGSGLYWIQWENGADYLSWSTPVHRDVWNEYLAEVWDVVLAGGFTYVFDIDPDGADVRMALLRSEPGALWKGRSQAEWVDVTDRIAWVPPESGKYGLVAYNEDGGYGSFDLVYGSPCQSDALTDGVTDLGHADEQFAHFTQSNQCWAVVAMRWRQAPGNADLIAVSDWDEGAVDPYCFGDVLAESSRPGTGVDLVVADFHYAALGTHYVELLWDSEPILYGVQWDGDDEVLDLETRTIERAVDESYIAEAWDVYLEEGHEYTFSFDPTGTELHMALFGQEGPPYWTPLDGAIWDATDDVVWTAPATDWYALVVYNEGGDIGWFSLSGTDTPVESTFIAELTAPATIRVLWSVPAGLAGTGLSLYRAPGSDGEYELLNDMPGDLATSGTYDDTDLWPGIEYSYDLRALRENGTEVSVQGSPITVRTENLATPRLLSAGPNPLIDEAVIRYHVPRDSDRVDLTVVSAGGAVVRTILDGALPGRGTHVATWDGRSDAGADVASGIYFYRLSVGSWETRGKLTVLR